MFDRRDPREASVLFEWVWPRVRRNADLSDVLTGKQAITNLHHVSLNRNEYAQQFNEAADKRVMLLGLPGIGSRLVVALEADILRSTGVQA